ncbi:hypothetical protein D3C73_945530 [compost metagenome]
MKRVRVACTSLVKLAVNNGCTLPRSASWQLKSTLAIFWSSTYSLSSTVLRVARHCEAFSALAYIVSAAAGSPFTPATASTVCHGSARACAIMPGTGVTESWPSKAGFSASLSVRAAAASSSSNARAYRSKVCSGVSCAGAAEVNNGAHSSAVASRPRIGVFMTVFLLQRAASLAHLPWHSMVRDSQACCARWPTKNGPHAGPVRSHDEDRAIRSWRARRPSTG